MFFSKSLSYEDIEKMSKWNYSFSAW